MDSFSALQETFCNIYGAQFDTAELDVVSVVLCCTVLVFYVITGKISLLLKNNKLKKGEQCGQPSGDISALAWPHRNQVTMSSTYHNDDMRMVGLLMRQANTLNKACDCL
jgi:hypothetical protein